MRNLVLRVIVAAIGAPLVVALAIHGSWPLVLLVVALQIGVLWEWTRLTSALGSRMLWPAVALALTGLDVAIFLSGYPHAASVAILSLAAMFFMETFRPERKPLASLGGSALYLLYAALPLALWTRLDSVSTSSFYRPAGALTALLLTTTRIASTSPSRSLPRVRRTSA